MVWRGSHVWARLGAARWSSARHGSRGKLWCCEVWRVLAGLGKAVKVLRGMSRLSEARLVRARLSKAVGVWHVEARCSMLRQNRGMAGHVKAVTAS
jgi:hypothetical protein